MLKPFEDNIITNLTYNLPSVEYTNPGPRPRCREYKLNEKGYRCDNFSKPHEISVVTLGCSNAFGWKLDEKYRFSNIFADKLAKNTKKEIANWNLSLTGKSNDYIARMTMCLPHTLKPNILLISFTALARREYFDINFAPKRKGCYDHATRRMEGGKSVFKDRNGECPFPQFLETSQNLMNLASPYEDLLNFYKNYKLIEMTCKLNNIQMLFTCSLCKDFENNDPFGTNNKLYVGYFKVIDKAEDNGHPGIKSNQIIADKFWRKYEDVYLDQN